MTITITGLWKHRSLNLFVLMFCLVIGSMLPASTLADTISAIHIEGNEDTEEATIRRELIVSVGDSVDITTIERSVQNVMDLGLFEDVSYHLEQHDPASGVELVISVVERLYFFVIPTAKTNDNNQVEVGAKMTWYNIMGLNHTLKWKALDAGTTSGVGEFKNDIRYSAPAVFSSRYDVNLNFYRDLFVDMDPDAGLQRELNKDISFDIARRFNVDGTSQGLSASLGLGYRSRDISSLQVASLQSPQSFSVNSIRFGLAYNDVHEHHFNRSGRKAAYRMEFASDAMTDGDVGFFLHVLDLRAYYMLSKAPPVNINTQFVIGTASDDLLGDKAFNLGGNSNLRGYEIGTIRGNTVLYGSIEYVDTLYRDPSLRKVLFVDYGQATSKLSDLRFRDLNIAAGAGIRWKLGQFVNVNIRVDLAYGFETDAYRIALGARQTF